MSHSVFTSAAMRFARYTTGITQPLIFTTRHVRSSSLIKRSLHRVRDRALTLRTQYLSLDYRAQAPRCWSKYWPAILRSTVRVNCPTLSALHGALAQRLGRILHPTIRRFYRNSQPIKSGNWERDISKRLESSAVTHRLDYCGLEFEEQCLRFYETKRAVRTPSSEQVRQPVYQQGLEQWRNFEEHLGPLKVALGPVLERYPI